MIDLFLFGLGDVHVTVSLAYFLVSHDFIERGVDDSFNMGFDERPKLAQEGSCFLVNAHGLKTFHIAQSHSGPSLHGSDEFLHHHYKKYSITPAPN
ncbi:unnamed protein product [Pararhodospirillum photometricum DSM 122]|uniref:Uncharacterized protein n=1 Tax=Pararhodospirillum photometricum DSM 122 TaxID=1150469 RepID=H6SMX2_PARPM|nr:unnamed protein product [Pararhodospirillum photometricum DSM 122]